MQWINDHSQLVSALTGVGTLLVWIIYLQVFVSSYRRQQRATLLITRGPGQGLAAHCFLTNMSAGPVYVQSVITTLDIPQGPIIKPATEMQDAEAEGLSRPLQRTRQGPLHPGEIRDIGAFEHLMAPALQEANQPGDAVKAVTITILGIYGSEDLPVGARRCFRIVATAGKLRVQGETMETDQIRKRRERRTLLADLQRDQ